MGALQAVLEMSKAVLDVLRDHLSGSEVSERAYPLQCLETEVARSVECALLDYGRQQSKDQEQVEKRRRVDDLTAALRSETGWREALREADGAIFLQINSAFDDWLAADPEHRALTNKLHTLQQSAVKWYGLGAQRHCDAFFGKLRAMEAALPAQREHFGKLLEEELATLRGALFEFPERPGAPPALFRLDAGEMLGGDTNGGSNSDGRDDHDECEVVADEATLA